MAHTSASLAGAVRLPAFSADSFPEWEQAVLALAIACHPERPDGTGLAGVVLARDTFRRMHGVTADFRPLAPPADVTNAASTFQYNAYAAERRAMSTLRAAVFASVPSGVLATAPGFDVGVLGALGVDLAGLMAHLRALYGAPSLLRYHSAMAALREPQGVRTLEELVGDHTRSHSVAERCGQAVTEVQKIRGLISAVHPESREVARRCYQAYAEGEANVAAHRFGAFATRLRTCIRAAGDTVEDPSGEMPTMAMAAKAPPARDPVLQAIAELTARVDRLASERPRDGADTRRPRRRVRGPGQPAQGYQDAAAPGPKGGRK